MKLREEEKNNFKTSWETRFCSFNPHLADDSVFGVQYVLSLFLPT